MPLRFLILVSSLALCLGAALGWVARAAAEELNAAETAAAGDTGIVTTVSVPGPVFDIGGASAAGKWVEQVNRTTWWNAMVQLEAARIAAQNVGSGRRTNEAGTRNQLPVSPGPAPSGDCSGYPSYVPTWKESNNQPDVVNPRSGTFGCAQLQPFHFASGGTCADLSTDYEGQRECAWRLPSSAWAG